MIMIISPLLSKLPQRSSVESRERNQSVRAVPRGVARSGRELELATRPADQARIHLHLSTNCAGGLIAPTAAKLRSRSA